MTSHNLAVVSVPIEYVVDLFPNIRSESKELSVYPVKNRLQEISLPGIFCIEKF